MHCTVYTIVLLGLSTVAFAQYECVKSCDPNYPETCPADSVCTNVGRTDTGEPVYSCFCNMGFTSFCYQQSTVLVMQCNQTANGCGSNYPNGCPGHSFCTLTSTAGKICICPERSKWNTNFTDCISVCPDNAELDEAGGCSCRSPYVPDPTSTTLRCIPDPTTNSCAGVDCARGYICSVTSTGGTQCIADQSSTVPRCGSNFRCPDAIHWDCIDTITAGAVCVCKDGWSGVGCLVPDCWEVNGEMGCWWPNGHAVCTADRSGNTFCQCLPGWSGDQCTQNDTLCAEVNCAGDTICREGSCVCLPGYYPNPTTETCTPIQDVSSCNGTCRGNQICIDTVTAGSICTCPEDVFGGYDCSRPSCSTNEDCTSRFPNSYCVTNVRTDINTYCTCTPGFTGPTCEDPVDSCSCSAPKRCDNEGRCRCSSDATESSDGTCVPISNPEDVCRYLVITMETTNEYTPEEIQKSIAQIVGVDTLNIEADGPHKDRNGLVYFYVTVCGDQDVDQTLAASDLFDQVEKGNTMGLPIGGVYDADSWYSSSANAAAFPLLIATAFCFSTFV